MNFEMYYKSRQGKMVNVLKELVRLESPTGDRKAVNTASATVVDELRKIGARVVRLPQKDIGDLHIVEYPGRPHPDLSDQILILTHIDTVWPVGKIQTMPFYLAGDKIFGPGVLDMKAGLVMVLFALKTLYELNLRPAKKIVLFINSAEEIGHKESHDEIVKLARRSDLCLCFEPALPGGALKLERKGRMVVRLEAQGKAAHGGTPEKGVNAIEELLRQIQRLDRLKKYETTVNVGVMGGGSKANIVAEHAWVILDIRFWTNDDKERIKSYFRDLKPIRSGARLKHSVESLTPPMEKTKASEELFQEARRIAKTLGQRLRGGKSGGGSDASIAANLGVPTLDGLGPDGDGIHAEHEHLLLSSFVERTALLTRLLIEL
jgi:glutamate carboxypeptidase